MLFSLDIVLRVLLEAALNTHLKEVSKGPSRERLFFPNTLLLAPLTGKVSANFRLELLPIEAM